MSIKIENISKLYGPQKALNEVSFEIGKGEIVGFLGPNGAGKSTMMKIITCYIPPSKGKALVCGLDVMEESLEVRKMVGYLPEHNPLYLDMYVKEYLRFIASIHKVKNKKDRVDEMIEKVGLTLERRKKIGALSKGYRQRVGLAQAMIHDPAVLILDEPTSGLDPNQLEDIRLLIQDIGREKTVMLSTHIMQEVEAICDRVIIINKGEIVADKSAKEIQQHEQDKQVVFVEFDQRVSRSQLKRIDSVMDAKEIDSNKWIIETGSEGDIRRTIAEFAQQNKLLTLEIRLEEQSMEEVFKKLTK